MKKRWRAFRKSLLPFPIYLLVRAIHRSLRLEIVGYEAVKDLPGGHIYAGWHGRTMLPSCFLRKGTYTIVSNSNDGDMQHAILTRIGYKTIRGSTGRDGMKALVESIRVLKGGAEIAFTPDGPRGPSGIVQPGIMFMARKSGAWLIPVGASAARRWLVKSWDRYLVPKPFSRACLLFGTPIAVPAHATDEEVAALTQRFQEALNAIEHEAELRMGHGSRR